MRAAGLLVCVSFGAAGQSVAAAPAFEVASVKLIQKVRNAEGWSFSDVKIAGPGRLVATNASLDECIRWAYEVKEYQVSGPPWLNSDTVTYNIEAKAPPETPAKQIRLMLQTLLAERFKLALHRESRMLSVYNLVVAKNGHKLQEAAPEGRAGLFSDSSLTSVNVSSQRASMAGLANKLSLDVGRPVFDRTEIKGFFRISLEWAREGDGASVFTAVQEQLGLKLEGAKAPIEVLVNDHAQRIPAEN
jgi:uncharacterized protein (TIGR03435 family)